MKHWMIAFFMIFSAISLTAEETLESETRALQIELEDEPSSNIITPEWAVGPIGPIPKEPPKRSQAKTAAAAVLGTAIAITIGLLVSGANTGHSPQEASGS